MLTISLHSEILFGLIYLGRERVICVASAWYRSNNNNNQIFHFFICRLHNQRKCISFICFAIIRLVVWLWRACCTSEYVCMFACEKERPWLDLYGGEYILTKINIDIIVTILHSIISLNYINNIYIYIYSDMKTM